MNPAEKLDAVVVGAGLSGLTAARELSRAGLETLVLEARSRPGGRTQTTGIEGVTVDLGGEWVDSAHMEIRNLAEDLGITLHPFERSKENARWRIRGEVSEEMPLGSRDAEVYRRMQEALVEIASGADVERPWTCAPEQDPSIAEWLKEAGMSEDGIHVVGTLISSCGSTVPLDRMSFYSYAVKVATRGGPGKGNEFRVEGGAGSIAEALAADLDGLVRYSAPVTEIRQYEGSVEARYAGERGPETVRARRMVLAVPFTCYRGINFDPEPPPTLRRMVSSSVYGVVRKAFFVFGGPVDPSIFAVTDTALGYCCATPAVNGESWGITSFAGGSPLLPELGRAPEKRKHRAMELLGELYGLPEPVAVVEKVWPDEYWTRGSYMIMASGDMTSFGEVMGGAFGNVYLAGAEGVAAAPSFMNSAVKAGSRAGSNVIQAMEDRRSRAYG